MTAIYRFTHQGKHGFYSGLFLAKTVEVEAAYGKEIQLAHHSGADLADFEWAMVEYITADAEAVEMFEAYELATGYNPLEHLTEEA